MPSGQNPWTQLLTGKRLRAKGDLSQLQGRLWRAIAVVEAGMLFAMEEGDADGVRKWVHCLTQLSSVYARIVLDSDLEQRLQALEAARQ